jgi:hypothetical protein
VNIEEVQDVVRKMYEENLSGAVQTMSTMLRDIQVTPRSRPARIGHQQRGFIAVQHRYGGR